MDAHICGIQLDHLPAQAKGLIECLNTSPHPLAKSISIVFCLAHAINLVFIHCLKNSSLFGDLIQQIIAIIPILRTPKAIQLIGLKCPLAVTSRWLYILDPLRFILKHRNTINLLLDPDSQIPLSFSYLYAILLPLRAFQNWAEKTSSALWELLPIATQIIQQFTKTAEILDESYYPLLQEVVSRFIARIIGNYYRIAATSLSFSSFGRYILRSQNEGNLTQSDGGLSMPDPVDALKDVTEFYENNINIIYQQIFNIPANNPANTPSNNTDNDPDSFSNDEIVNDEVAISIEEIVATDSSSQEEQNETGFQSYENEYSQLQNEELSSLLTFDFYKYLYQYAVQQISETATTLEIDAQLANKLFDQWLFNKTSTLSFSSFISQDPSIMWRKAIATNSDWKPLAIIALHFVSLGTSEADVERCVSIQRDMQINKTRINLSTIKARMKLRLREQHNDD